MPDPADRETQDLTPGRGENRAARSGPPAFDAPTLAPSETPGRTAGGPGPPHPNPPPQGGEGTAPGGEGSLAAPRQVGEYEILSEIARGGMGVVFKARHKKLDRLCALKMILAGQLASQHDVQRFFVEAEAAARLDHPGIVPLYDIGEHRGQHYFSMKLIEGGDLRDRVGELQKNPHAAAALLAKVARAVQHAHERGILHRDLKPSNILIDEQGQPVVTDFGLAKRVGGEGNPPGPPFGRGGGGGGVTQTGTVLGTPGYMAPEQATGQADGRQVTTAADIYSLGAILYELLTGRPPYTGDTALATMLKLLEGPPPAPREVNPKVDRDLELICLKCLSRDPHDRYAAAAAVAADLENFLADRPLSIRPPAMATLFRVWFRENARAVVWTAVIGLLAGLLMGIACFPFVAQDLSRWAAAYRQLPHVERPWLVFDHPLPRWSEIVAIPVLFALMVYLGFVIAAVIRPTSRQSALAAGLGAGFVASMTAFTASVAWGPVYAISVAPSLGEIEALSVAAFHRPQPGEGHAADRIMHRYPDLQDVPPGERGSVLASKIKADLAAGLLPGIWLAMAIALGMGIMPGVCGTLGAYAVLRERGTLLRAFLPYTEVAIVATSVGAMFLYWFAPMSGADYTPLPLWLFLLTMAPLVVAFFGVVVFPRRLQWRLALHVMWLAGVGHMLYQQYRADHVGQIAFEQLTQGRYAEAAETLEEAFQRHPRAPALPRMQAAVLNLYLGNQERYERHCRVLLDRVADTDDPQEAERAAKTCLATARGLEGRKEAFELADRAIKLGAGHQYMHWFELARGMSAYRQDEWEEALQWLQKSLVGGDNYRFITAHTYRAMSLWKLGRHEKARQALMQADQAYEDLKAVLKRNNLPWLGNSWHDVFLYELARKEAEELMSRGAP
jgi:serine/threonine protein kinase